jgi:hypothetical protein
LELWHRHRYSRGRSQPGKPIEDRGTDLQFGDLAVEVTRHDAFTKQLEASHLAPDKVALVVGAPLLPDFPAKPVRGRQESVAGCGPRALSLSWLGVLASRDNRLRSTFRNRFVTAFGVEGTIAADAGDDLIGGNLVE